MEFKVFRRQIKLAKTIADMLDYVSEAGIVFKLGVAAYLRPDIDSFNTKLKEITRLEHIADELRREIERQLYIKTLIPESRGDVLELLESLDTLLDKFKAVLWQFEIQIPDIPKQFHQEYTDLSSNVVKSVEYVVLSARSFFKDTDTVSDHIHKVSAWESEADYVNTRLQKQIYRSEDIDLSHKNQLRDFARRIDRIADMAEDVADRLSIYVIKRML